jgi:hypothetical protein
MKQQRAQYLMIMMIIQVTIKVAMIDMAALNMNHVTLLVTDELILGGLCSLARSTNVPDGWQS